MSDGGAFFRVRTDAKARVKAQMQELSIVNNNIGGYEYNAAVTLLKQINRVLEHQLFKKSADVMVGLVSKIPNTLTRYKSNVAIKKRDVKKQSISKAAMDSTTDSVVAQEITTNYNAQDKADRQNTACLAAIGVKEAIAVEIMVIVGAHITNPILRMTDGSDFRTVDQYNLRQLLSAVTNEDKLPSVTENRQMMVDAMATSFDWRESVATNLEKNPQQKQNPPPTASNSATT